MTKHNQKTNLVNQQFSHQIKEYTIDSTAKLSPIIPELLDWLKKQPQTPEPLKICEFGGGGGTLLNEIQKQTNHTLKLTNAELVKSFQPHQASNQINFVQTSILDSNFPNNHFDVILLRNVLHHLIGDNLKQTRTNQQKAIKELARIVKPNGIILLEEQTNQSKFSCTAIYFLSKLACKLKLNIKKFQVTPHTLVGYLTHQQLEKIVQTNLKIIDKKYSRWNMELKWKLILLLHNTGTSIFILKKYVKN